MHELPSLLSGPAPPRAVPPVQQYGHSKGRCAVVGGHVYRGTQISNLQGAYVYGDYARHQIRFATLATPSTVATDGLLMSTGELQPTWIGAARWVPARRTAAFVVRWIPCLSNRRSRMRR